MMFKWGVVATGDMADNLCQAIAVSKNSKAYGVASRSLETAQAFADVHGIDKAYAPYQALFEDEMVDAIYIATPHTSHAELVQAALHAGKAVLCEKPFAMTAGEVETCVALAREKNLFLMEAMWTRFFPIIREALARVQSGAIGSLTGVEGRFHFERTFNPEHRLYKRELGGGVLLDIGVYLLAMAQAFLGAPKSARGLAEFGPTGIDIFDMVRLNYEKARASLSFGMTWKAPREFVISGSEGYLKIHDIFFKPNAISIVRNDGREEHIHLPFKGNGYVHMVEDVTQAIIDGKTEHPFMPLNDTLAIAKVMDDLRSQWGLVYPNDEKA